VSNFLTVDGTISASGGSYQSPHAGGGSGGSIAIHTYVVDGDGSIQVGGGDGYSASTDHGGGGAGGRMAMYYVQNQFVGELCLFVSFFFLKDLVMLLKFIVVIGSQREKLKVYYNIVINCYDCLHYRKLHQRRRKGRTISRERGSRNSVPAQDPPSLT
jgi:hypothetical protein